MKKLLVLILFSGPIFLKNSHALIPSFGVKTGMNIASASYTDGAGESIDGTKSGTSFLMIGATLSMELGPVGVMADLLYSQHKWKIDDDLETVSSSIIKLPVQVTYSFIPMFFVSGGAYYSMGVGKLGSQYEGEDKVTATYEEANY